MTNLKNLIAIMMFVGLIGISQAFACKSLAGGLQNLPQTAVLSQPASGGLSQSKDEDPKGPSLRDLTGRYVSYATATFFDQATNRTLYATCIGVVTFDGRGHFTDKEVHSYDGVIVRDEFTGRYTVNADGSGSMHYVGQNESYDQEIVLSNDAKDITFLILLDVPGLVSQGTMKKQ